MRFSLLRLRLAAAFLFIACGRDGAGSRSRGDTSLATETILGGLNERSEPSTGTVADRLRCGPESLHVRDTLTLTMQVPHGPYLAVTTPDRLMYFLIRPDFGDSVRFRSLVPSDSFRTMNSYRIPATIRAKPWVYGRESLEAVFEQPGIYRIQVGENLETDYGPLPTECRIVYQVTRR